MKIFITGSTGFIGKRLVNRLYKEGYSLVCSGRHLGKLKPLMHKVEAVYLDIENRAAVKRALERERPEVVFHCAALVENGPLKRLKSLNVEGTRNLMDACLLAGVKKVIYLSSVAAISGNDESPLRDDMPYAATNNYGVSKIEAEKLVISYREKGLKIAILRPCMVYGENEPHLLSLLAKLIKARLLPIIGDGNNILQLVDVENVVDVMMLCLTKDKAFEDTYIVADREALSVKEVLWIIANTIEAKKPFHITYMLMPLLIRIPFIGKNFFVFTKDRAYSIDRLRDNLDYVPRISIYKGLPKAILSYNKK